MDTGAALTRSEAAVYPLGRPMLRITFAVDRRAPSRTGILKDLCPRIFETRGRNGSDFKTGGQCRFDDAGPAFTEALLA